MKPDFRGKGVGTALWRNVAKVIHSQDFMQPYDRNVSTVPDIRVAPLHS